MRLRAWREEIPCSLHEAEDGGLAVKVERAFSLEAGASVEFRIGPGRASALVWHPSAPGRLLALIAARLSGKRGVHLEMDEPQLRMGGKPIGRG